MICVRELIHYVNQHYALLLAGNSRTVCPSEVSQILAELQSLKAITSQQRVPAFPSGKEKEGPKLDAGHQAGPAPLIDGFLGHERRLKIRSQAVN